MLIILLGLLSLHRLLAYFLLFLVSKSGLGELNERLDKMTLNSPKCYKDNPLNRRLGRAGKPLGTCVVSKTGEKPRAKCYVNNAFNRRQGRVGKPLGSAPVRDAYRDTEFNRRLKRVGKPWGTCPDSQRANRDKMIEIIDALMSYLQRQVGLLGILTTVS